MTYTFISSSQTLGLDLTSFCVLLKLVSLVCADHNQVYCTLELLDTDHATSMHWQQTHAASGSLGQRFKSLSRGIVASFAVKVPRHI